MAALFYQAIQGELRRFYFGWAPAELWLWPGVVFSPEALAACRQAVASGDFAPLVALPLGSGLTDNLHLAFFRSPQQQLKAALVLDPLELWADLRVLEIRPAAGLPTEATLLQ